jgi:hypothetical protein
VSKPAEEVHRDRKSPSRTSSSAHSRYSGRSPKANWPNADNSFAFGGNPAEIERKSSKRERFSRFEGDEDSSFDLRKDSEFGIN